MKFFDKDEQKLLEQQKDLLNHQDLTRLMKKYRFKHFLHKLKLLLSPFKRKKAYKYKFKKIYKDTSLDYPNEFVLKEWEHYYSQGKHDLNTFIKLLKCYDFPDVKNYFDKQDERHHQFHHEYLIGNDIIKIFKFINLDNTRKMEIIRNYDSYLSKQKEIEQLNFLKNEIAKIQDILKENKDRLESYVQLCMEVEKEPEKAILDEYDRIQQVCFDRFNTLSKEFDELNKIINVSKDDVDYFEELIEIGNVYTASLLHSKVFHPQILNDIDANNLSYFFLICLCLAKFNQIPDFEPQILKDNILTLKVSNPKFLFLSKEELDELFKAKEKNYQHVFLKIV